MGLTYYTIYGDETGTHGSGPFYLGALLCSSAQAQKIITQLNVIKDKYHINHEMKWHTVSKGMLSAYMDYIDTFLDNKYAQFAYMEVKPDNKWHLWASSEEERFFKSYYVFLRKNINVMYYKYIIYLDDKVTRRKYRWSSLHYAVNNALKRDFEHLGKRNFVKIQPIDSKGNDLLQLVDILLGAIHSKATAPTKTKIAEHVQRHLADTTRTISPKPKFISQRLDYNPNTTR